MIDSCRTKIATVNGSITTTTVGNPDVTFVSPIVGTDLQFSGFDSSPGVTLVRTSPESIEINATGIYPSVLPLAFVGIFQLVTFTGPVPEIPFQVDTTIFNNGLFVGSDLVISARGRYMVCLSPTYIMDDLFRFAEVRYRIRNSIGDVYAEFYCRNQGNDQNTTSFTQVIDFVPDTYTFTVQAFSFDAGSYNDMRVELTAISVKLV